VTGEPIRKNTVELTASDGYALKGRVFAPQRPRGAVLVIHGIQSHSGWYEASSEALAAKGFFVLAVDRRGSGMNGRDRGHVSSFQVWLDDLELARAHAAEHSGAARVHIEGISWGGNLALAFAAWKPQLVRSIALVAPGLEPKVDLSGLQKAGVGLAAALGSRKLFAIPISDGTMFTANPDRIRYIDSDPLLLREATGRFFVESARLSRYWRKRVASIECPAMLMLAGRDRIISNERTRATFSRLGSKIKTAVLYEGAHHTLEFEQEPEPFFRDLVAWFEKHNED